MKRRRRNHESNPTALKKRYKPIRAKHNDNKKLVTDLQEASHWTLWPGTDHSLLTRYSVSSHYWHSDLATFVRRSTHPHSQPAWPIHTPQQQSQILCLADLLPELIRSKTPRLHWPNVPRQISMLIWFLCNPNRSIDSLFFRAPTSSSFSSSSSSSSSESVTFVVPEKTVFCLALFKWAQMRILSAHARDATESSKFWVASRHLMPDPTLLQDASLLFVTHIHYHKGKRYMANLPPDRRYLLQNLLDAWSPPEEPDYDMIPLVVLPWIHSQQATAQETSSLWEWSRNAVLHIWSQHLAVASVENSLSMRSPIRHCIQTCTWLETTKQVQAFLVSQGYEEMFGLLQHRFQTIQGCVICAYEGRPNLQEWSGVTAIRLEPTDQLFVWWTPGEIPTRIHDGLNPADSYWSIRDCMSLWSEKPTSLWWWIREAFQDHGTEDLKDPEQWWNRYHDLQDFVWTLYLPTLHTQDGFNNVQAVFTTMHHLWIRETPPDGFVVMQRVPMTEDGGKPTEFYQVWSQMIQCLTGGTNAHLWTAMRVCATFPCDRLQKQDTSIWIKWLRLAATVRFQIPVAGGEEQQQPSGSSETVDTRVRDVIQTANPIQRLALLWHVCGKASGLIGEDASYHPQRQMRCPIMGPYPDERYNDWLQLDEVKEWYNDMALVRSCLLSNADGHSPDQQRYGARPWSPVYTYQSPRLAEQEHENEQEKEDENWIHPVLSPGYEPGMCSPAASDQSPIYEPVDPVPNELD